MVASTTASASSPPSVGITVPRPPPPPFANPSPTGPWLTTSRTAPQPSLALALLVISWGVDEPCRVLTRVAPLQRAVERAVPRAVWEAAPDRQPPAAAKVRGVGVGESERFEVDGFGDDLSEVFGGGSRGSTLTCGSRERGEAPMGQVKARP